MDWRNPEDYGYALELSLTQWAWEFLRRSEVYKKTYDELEKAAIELYSGKKAGDSVDLPASILYAGERFGLSGQFVGPEARADSVGELSWMEWPIVARRWNPSYKPGEPWPGAPNAIALIFHFGQPIDKQIQSAERRLNEMREALTVANHPTPGKVQIRKDTWVKYLRLLDGKAAGASIAEMGRVIYDENLDPRKSAQDALRRAKAMANGKYRQLVAQKQMLGEGN